MGLRKMRRKCKYLQLETSEKKKKGLKVDSKGDSEARIPNGLSVMDRHVPTTYHYHHQPPSTTTTNLFLLETTQPPSSYTKLPTQGVNNICDILARDTHESGLVINTCTTSRKLPKGALNMRLSRSRATNIFHYTREFNILTN
ncbi:hypothetical protein M0804_010352 [Polistes exclamans]|nr:hypothetical protein M0804_010352 [Polistes exclamans]